MKNDSQKATDIIADAGGRIVGRTRLQKTAYLLEVAGLGEGFHFDYHHYGPYSEELARAASTAQARDFIEEKEHKTNWGGFYSEYLLKEPPSSEPSDPVRVRLAREAADADAVSLELAATAAFFAKKGNPDPWEETAQRKPDKAAEHLDDAKDLYARLRGITDKLPEID